MYIDTHAHLTMKEFSDLEAVISRAKAAEVCAIINASFDLEASLASVKLAEKYDFIYAAVGIHPNDSNSIDENAIKALKDLAANKKVVAIGETGLDYFHKDAPPERQKEAFKKHLGLAQELGLPAIIHCRDAQDDVMQIMLEENKGDLRAVFHCFSGDEKLVDFAIKNNYMVSFTGNITFKKAQNLRDIIKKIPLEFIMVETDCPYLAPEPYRGKRNEPAYVVYVAESIAKEKGLSLEAVAEATTKNARAFFKV